MMPVARLIILVSAIAQHAFGFSFNTSTPNQCGQLTIQWDGGQEPFQFLLVPTVEVSAGHIQNISIPRGLSQPYSYTFDLEQPAGLQFLATMYDSTGFGSGGTTPVLTVGSSDNTSCLTTDLTYSFTFSISPTENPSQCSSQTVSWPSSVTRPVNLFGLIPGGTAFQIPIPQDGTSYDWQVNIDDGTEYLLAMSDAGPNVTGGSSPLITVAGGSDSCMNDTSPRAGGSGSGAGTATSAGPSASASVSGVGGGSSGGTSGSGGSSQDNTGGGGGSSTPVGAIVGGTVGGVAFLVLLAVLLFFCLRKRARQRRDSTDPIIRSYGANGAQTTEKRRTGAMDLLAGRGGRAERALSDDSQVETGLRGDEYQPSPFRYPDSTQAAGMTGAAAAGATGAGNRHSQPASEKTGTPPAAAFMTRTDTRPSFESNNTTNHTHPGSTPPHAAVASPTVPPATESGRTDMATLGHGVQRNSSIAKHGPHGAAAAGDSPAAAGRPLPGTPTQRFVQHEDSGEVVDLPPRYDQLRARNPDPAQ